MQRNHAATDGTHKALRIPQAVTLMNLELSKEDEANVGKDEREVRREDQDKINKFSKLHQRETALEDELKTKAVWETLFVFSNVDMTDECCRRTRRILRNCQMSWNWQMMMIGSRRLCAELLSFDRTENGYRYKIGDTFVSLPLSEVQGMLTTSTEKIEESVSAVEGKLSIVRDEMEQLKVQLYARFGKSINLET